MPEPAKGHGSTAIGARPVGDNASQLAATAGSNGSETVSAFLDKSGRFPILVQHLQDLRLDPAHGGTRHDADRVGWADRGGPGHPKHPIGAGELGMAPTVSLRKLLAMRACVGSGNAEWGCRPS